MDETEKYKQRLEAIAEKRRLQEEQDKARRDVEDEKLRVQQLKRKSLRDKWLMEGAPLSPTYLNDPHSPPLSTQAQDMEKDIDKSKSENQRWAEEQEKLEDHQKETVQVAEAGAEIIQDILQNGQSNAQSSASDDEVKVNQSPPEMETAVVLTNGGGDLEASSNHMAPEQGETNTHGPVRATECGDSMNLEPDMDVTEAESGQFPSVNNDEEEEEGTVVMRAECVIITDEGDDVPEELPPQDQQVSVTLDPAPLSNPEAGKETGEAVEEVMKTLTDPERSEATEGTTEAQPAAEDEGMDGGVKSSSSADGETNVEGQDEKTEDPASVREQPPATVALVPVYAEMPSSALSPDIKAEGETTTAPEEAEAALKASLPGQFQEVSLTDPQDNLKTEAGPGEQEPLLLKAEANAKAESARASSPGSAEAPIPSRGRQGGDSEPPKHKSCQCCSVM
ncbi:paralemmin-3 isoform X2 [Leuresthes tenuis]|uniref:paralemmin-3 isoform X2 n=1 Tax=Leuresthes tenuis TaxID=355514 RepID=UPI003B510F1A